MPEIAEDQDFDWTLWADDLSAKLTNAGAGYIRVAGKEDETEELEKHPGIRANRASFAMLTVGTVMKKVEELPGMRGHVGLAPLHDLVAALWDLGRGSQPTMLRPVSGIGVGGEHTADRWIRQNALLAVLILEESGMKGRPACRFVAQVLADQGHMGRKRSDGPKPLSEGTVVDWRNRSRQRDFSQRDPAVSDFLRRNLDRFRAANQPCPSQSDAKEYVAKVLTSPLVRSKSG